ncbi:MAG: amidohydrolase [Pseudomonadales bacterium]|nr:amidohydrolase [Pseudomonadales bacterium]
MKVRTILRAPSGLLFGMLCSLGAYASPDVNALKASLQQVIDAHYGHVEEIYHDIHQHPELAFNEVRTASVLASEMRSLGFEVTEHIGKTGVVAMLRNGEGPLILVRTELDALPMPEKTGLPYASRQMREWRGVQTPVAHSCGHDIHMSVWIEAATALVATRDRWRGTLMFVAQPAEENDSGAEAMMKDGLYARFGKPDHAVALHTGPFGYGMVGYRAGAVMSAEDTLEIVFKGHGGHGSSPHSTIDPVLIASRFVVDVQSLVSREKDPSAFGVVTVGAIHGGSAGNIIPDEVTLRGTIRSYAPEVGEKLTAGVRRIATAEAALSAAPDPMISITHDTDALVNDPASMARAAAVLQAAFGRNAFEMSPVPASEDFTRYAEGGVPLTYFFIGVYEPARFIAAMKSGESLPSNHSPLFAPVPKPTIETGALAMSLVVLDFLGAE